MQLKDNVEELLKASELEDPKCELEELPTGTVFGRITSPSFSGRSLAQNSKAIWDVLEKNLPEAQLKRIESEWGRTKLTG